MKSEIMKITPEMARDLLATSHGNFRYANTNRTVNPVIVKKYAADMINGNWKINPQGIIIDENGVLIDGHHRLNAVIMSGKTVEFNVCCDAPENCVEVLDCGWVRTPYIMLEHTRGINKTAASKRGWALAKLHFYYYFGARDKVLSLPSSVFSDFITEHAEDIKTAINSAEHEANRVRITCNAASNYAAFCALKCGVPADTINRFFEIATTGMYDVAWQTPAIVLRNQFIRSSSKGCGTSASIKNCNYVQTCLNDYVQMKPRTKPYNDPKPVFTNIWFDKLGKER